MKIVAGMTLATAAIAALAWAQTSQLTLVKGSPTNYGTNGFDISWIDNSTQKYYLADRTNNAIDLVDAATNTFLGFFEKAQNTASRPCLADATKPGSAIIRKIPTGGKFRVDEMAYDPTDQMLMVSSDGDSPPFLTFISVKDGSVSGQYKYPLGQDGMEQPAWVSETRWYYQNVPGEKNRIDVFDPH